MPGFIVSVVPTLFVKEIHGSRRRVVRVTTELDSACRCTLVARGPEIDETVDLGETPAGTTEHECMLPDSRKSGILNLGLTCDGRAAYLMETKWIPARHWVVDLIHMSHHDWGYTGIPSDVQAEQISSMDDVLDWCEETERWPESSKFRYLCEQGWSVIPWIERSPVSAVDKFMSYVRKGQLEIPAIWGNQITELCGHEELVRLMYPSAEIGRKYNVPIVSAVHNDIPGFSWGMVSTLVGGGVKYLGFSMPKGYYGTEFGDDRKIVHQCWDEDEFLPVDMPGAFLWEGPDGARLFTYYVLNYGRVFPLPWTSMEKDMEKELNEFAAMGYPHDIIGHMVASGWRDNSPPTLRIAEICREWNVKWVYPRLETATNASFMAELWKRHGGELDVYQGELPNTDYTVCSTCTPKETAVNRRAHETLVTAEELATVASSIAGYTYPTETINDAYRSTFTYDLHCWGLYDCGGPAMDASWDEKRGAATRAAALAHDVVTKATNRIADRIAYPDEGYYLTVFNPLARSSTTVVRMPAGPWAPATSPMHHPEPGERLLSGGADGRPITVLDKEFLENEFDLVDAATGEAVEYQMSYFTDSGDPRLWSAERVAMGRRHGSEQGEVVFTAEKLPPFGYRTYRLVPADGKKRKKTERPAYQSTLESRFYSVNLNGEDGSVSSIIDRESGRELVDAGAPHGFGNLVVRRCADAAVLDGKIDGVTLVEDGPVFTTIRVKGDTPGVPRWTKDIIIYKQIKRIDVNARLLRDSEPNLELYFAFPFLAREPKFRFEASGSVIEALKDQLPGSNTDYYAVQNWVEVDDSSGTIAWAPVDNQMVELGGLWPGYVSGAHHGVTGPGYGHPWLKPGDITEGHIYSLVMYNNYQTNFINVQPSEFTCRFSFTSFGPDGGSGNAGEFGRSVARPANGVWMKGPAAGPLPPEGSFCRIDAGNVILLCLKRAEDGHGHIIRLMETCGERTDTSVALPWLDIRNAWETDLVERNEKPVNGSGTLLRVGLEPWQIKTYRVLD